MSLAYQIIEMFSKLSAESQEDLLQELNKIHSVKKSLPKKSYLEKKWEEIEELMEELELEPYIDDQVEIELIWNLSEEIIKSGRLKGESWDIRRRIIRDIAQNDYYDCYGVYDPMENLMKAMLFDCEEVIECAEYMMQADGYMKQNAAELLKEHDIMDRYYEEHGD